MTYTEFIDLLLPHAEEKFAAFQRKLISTKYEILGVRTPVLRKLAKEYAEHFNEVFAFPNEYFEIVFIKLAMAAVLPYERFVPLLTECVSLMDNWALCDCFKAKCLRKNKDKFLVEIERIFFHGGEYFERYALVALLAEYVEKKYLPIIESYLKRADTKPYYIHMAAAWLTAEVLVKAYDFGVSILQKGILERKTHNKAIQKAIESYRLTNEQKEYLRSLKIKTK